MKLEGVPVFFADVRVCAGVSGNHGQRCGVVLSQNLPSSLSHGRVAEHVPNSDDDAAHAQATDESLHDASF